MAHQFEDLVRKDDRFEITEKVVLGLVCFRLRVRPNEFLVFHIHVDISSRFTHYIFTFCFE